MKRTLQIANTIALLQTMVLNFLSASGMIANKSVREVSASYQNLFTPAGYAFSIWGLIYLLLLGFVLYQWQAPGMAKAANAIIHTISGWFVVSCMANCAWLLAWLFDYTFLSVILMVILLFSLLRIVIVLNLDLTRSNFKERLFLGWPFTIYTGWITVALIANIAALLTKENWNGWNIGDANWAVIMIIVAGLINLYMIFARHMILYALTGIWALIAIAVANWNETAIIVNSSIATSVILLIACGVDYFYRRKLD